MAETIHTKLSALQLRDSLTIHQLLGPVASPSACTRFVGMPCLGQVVASSLHKTVCALAQQMFVVVLKPCGLNSFGHLSKDSLRALNNRISTNEHGSS